MLENLLVFNKRKIASLLIFMLFMAAFTGLAPFAEETIFESDYTESGGGSLIRQLVYVLIFTLSFACYRNASFIDLVLGYPPIKFLLLFCIISFLWSQSPVISFRRAMLLSITTTTIFFIIDTLGVVKSLEMLSKTFFFIISISFLSCLFIPGALHTAPTLFDTGLEGNWRGVFVHKNIAGAAAAVSIILSTYQYLQSKDRFWLLSVVLSVLFLIFTSSKTSIGFIFPSLLIGLFFSKLFKFKSFGVIFLFLMITLAMPLLVFSEALYQSLLAIIADPESFTGRGSIWSIVLKVIEDYFWFGLGYGAAWAVGNDMIIPDYAFGYVDWVFKITEGHNGYFDTILTVGFLGFLIFMATFIIHPLILVIKRKDLFQENDIFLIVSSYTFFLFQNCMEATFLNSSSGLWFYLIFIYFIVYSKSKHGR